MSIADELNTLAKAKQSKRLHTKLKYYRKYTNLSFREIASVVKISAPTLQRYEAGKVKSPSIRVLSSLADFYKIPLEELASLTQSEELTIGGLNLKEYEVLSSLLKHLRNSKPN